MAEISSRDARLNLLTLEAVTAAIALHATVLLSVEAALGVLPGVLDAEHIEWRTVEIQ